ncbi:reverse transcriptase domain-containing protein, partial [Tanacetum coccineum]
PEIRTYDISYILIKEAEGLVEVLRSSRASRGNTRRKRRRNIHLKREALSKINPNTNPEEKMHSYAIRLKFNAYNYVMDCEALLAGLAASTNQGMKDLHVFIDSLTLVAQVEGNHTPPTEQERRVGNHKPRISQPGSIGRYQNKTIGRRDKQDQERENNKQCTRNETKLQP